MGNIDKLLNEIRENTSVASLSKEEEISLGQMIQYVETSAEEKHGAIRTLVLNNIRLVLKEAYGYKRGGFDLEDLVGYGIIGLFKAAEKFNPDQYKNRFAAYARHWIKEAIMKAIRECSGAPKVPVYLVKNLWAVTRAVEKREEHSDQQIAETTGISVDNVIYLKSLLFKFVQFDPEYVTPEITTPEDVYAKKEREQLLYETLKEKLTEDEFIVISYFWGIGVNKLTLEKIKVEFGISNPCAVKKVALEKLSGCQILKILYNEEG